jgi:hypothetical protein
MRSRPPPRSLSIRYALSNQERPVGVTKALQGVNQLIVGHCEMGSRYFMLLMRATDPAPRERPYHIKRPIRFHHV